MKVTAVNKIKPALLLALSGQFVIVFSIALITFFIMDKDIDRKNKELSNKEIQSAITVFNAELSSGMDILANTDVFIDFIRSGKISRDRVKNKFLMQLKLNKIPFISGMMIADKKGQELFLDGDKKDRSVTVDICYLNHSLSHNLGDCKYTWELFLDKEAIISFIKKINPNIIECANCMGHRIFPSEKIGNFTIVNDNFQEVEVEVLPQLSREYHVYFLFFVLFCMGILAYAYKRKIDLYFEKYIVSPLASIQDYLKGDVALDKTRLGLAEYEYLGDSIVKWREKNEEAERKIQQAKIGKLITQIIHDIRTPISIIGNVIRRQNLSQMESKRLINRAVDQLERVTSEMLDMYKSLRLGRDKNNLQVEPIEILMHDIISEFQGLNSAKHCRLEFEGKINEACIVGEYFKLKRVFFNLLNNSAEAIGKNFNGNGIIKISGLQKEDKYHLYIEDNGPGIPESIVNKIFKEGFSTKETGVGMGAVVAKEIVESFGGEIKITSTEKVGTVVEVVLRVIEKPAWLINKIFMNDENLIVVLDDDLHVHRLWKKKIETVSCEVVCFSKVKELENFLRKNKKREIIYIIDYDLSEPNSNGVTVIKELGIGGKSIISTYKYYQEDIRKFAAEECLGLLPKNYAEEVLLIADKKLFVLIDDDPLVRELWEIIAAKEKKTLQLYSSFDQFIEHKAQIGKEATIFIDLNLGNNQSGLVLAKELYQLGYGKIYITTGEPMEEGSSIEYIMGVVGKEPPFADSKFEQ